MLSEFLCRLAARIRALCASKVPTSRRGATSIIVQFGNAAKFTGSNTGDRSI
jgi:hypothetical protein